MIRIFLAAILAVSAFSAVAEPTLVPPGKFNAPIVLEKCKQGCVVLDSTDIQELQAQVQAIAQAAFLKGVAAGIAKEKGTI